MCNFIIIISRYLLGNQLSSQSSVEGYVNALRRACRCVERNETIKIPTALLRIRPVLIIDLLIFQLIFGMDLMENQLYIMDTR